MDYLQPIEFSNQRILTTEQLAEEYKVEIQIIINNFNRNKKRYIEGKHYYFLDGENLKEFLQLEMIEVQNMSKIRSLYLWTERGAFLHAKSLNNDIAWDIYENLVDSYFRPKENISTIKSLEERVIALEQKINNQNKKEIPSQLQTTNILNTFLDGINELISSGEYYLIDIKTATNKESRPKNLLGYYDNKFIYMQSEIAYNAIFEFCTKNNLPFASSIKALLKELEKGDAIIFDNGGHKKSRSKAKRIGENKNRYIWLKKSALNYKR